MTTRATSTDCIITFGLFASSVKTDAIPDVSGIVQQPFSSMDDVIRGNVVDKPYASLEPDFWVLDGNYHFLPDDAPHVGLMSANMSGVGGAFAAPPVLVVRFSKAHSTNGITLKFSQHSNDYAKNIVISFYDSVGALIRTDSYFATDWEFTTNQPVDDYQSIQISFMSTNKPYRYLRLTAIDFGRLVTFTKTQIKSASIIEEIDPTSRRIPGNAAELVLFSEDAAFSSVNPQGSYADLRKRQPLEITAIVNGEKRLFGTYFLENWENQTEKVIKFRCVDPIMILETAPKFYGGMYVRKLVSELLVEIMAQSNVQCVLDPVYNDATVTGWLPVARPREQIRRIAFALGAYVSSARSNSIHLSPVAFPSLVADYTYGPADQGEENKPQQKDLVTGVIVNSHDYVKNSTVTQLYKGSLDAGDYPITFDKPMHNLAVTGASLSLIEANRAVITVATPGAVVLTGMGYTDVTSGVRVYDDELDSAIDPNEIEIDDATLVGAEIVEDVATRVYDYYQQRVLLSSKLFQPRAQTGKIITLATIHSQSVRGIVEKQETDLARGFVVNTQITGALV